jgi:hypothetical protein
MAKLNKQDPLVVEHVEKEVAKARNAEQKRILAIVAQHKKDHSTNEDKSHRKVLTGAFTGLTAAIKSPIGE